MIVKTIFNTIFNTANTRLIDVFFTGPLQILISSYMKNVFLKYYMLIVGISNIIYNGHNYLLFDEKIKSPYLPLPILKSLIYPKYGKTQMHRIYNLLIMYPIFTYIVLFTKLPYILSILLTINIFIGFFYNLYYFVVLL
jgi:hypothetical protein